jgi:DNA-binding beta-propeller fold protein YncE
MLADGYATGKMEPLMKSNKRTSYLAATVIAAGALSLVGQMADAAVLFVPDGTGNIVEFTPSGQKSTYTSILGNPTGLAFDSGGDLYVTDQSDNNAIYKFTPSGIRTTFASGLNRPEGIAIDSSGQIYVADHDSGKIYRFTTTGNRFIFASGLTGPSGLAVDGNGNLFVSEDSGNIAKFSPSGQSSIFASGGLPSGLAFDSHGNLFEVDFGDGAPGSGSINKFTPQGAKTTFASGLNDPIGIAIDPSDNVYEGNVSDHTIFKFTPGGAESVFATGLVHSLFFTFAPVPEPSSIVVFGILSLLGLAVFFPLRLRQNDKSECSI